MSRLYILAFVFAFLAVLIFFRKKDKGKTIPAGEGLVIKKEWLMTNPHPITPKEEIRSADQTFLTFPEWFLVFSPEEQAEYFQKHTASTFPFASHTSQLWDSYKIINQQIKGNFPVNTGYHFMIWVIATSTTVENGAKSLYETIIGRLTDTHDVITAEDKFNADFTRSYVNFIKDRPWYEFDFKTQLKTLWGSVPFFGDHFLRKAERRYALTFELTVKFLYGKLIGVGTKTVYDVALPTTAVLVDKMPMGFSPQNVIKQFDNQTVLINLPRYDKFNAAACELSKEGINFLEVAGNNSAILFSIIVPSDFSVNDEKLQVVFTQPIASDLTRKRIALAVPVPDLSTVLLSLTTQNVFIEHIFDF
jgi:hypothetical protein